MLSVTADTDTLQSNICVHADLTDVNGAHLGRCAQI